MAENSKIEWCRHTFNPWRGCTKVSEECDICYAETLSKRNPGTLGIWGKYGTRVVASESMWKQPLKWNAIAEALGERHRVFCASLADVFEDEKTMPETAWTAVEDARIRLFDLIDRTPHLDWLLLTKRPENVERLWRFPRYRWCIQCNITESTEDEQLFWMDSDANDGYGAWRCQKCNAVESYARKNVWIGTSVGVKKTKNRIDALRQIPAAVRFLSCEPLLEDLGELDLTGIDLVIAGGESGATARPMHPDWVRSIRDQCKAAGVRFFFKQWGEWLPLEDADEIFCEEDVAKMKSGDLFRDGTFFTGDDIAASLSLDVECMVRVGKHNAGRILDGREWNEMAGFSCNRSRRRPGR